MDRITLEIIGFNIQGCVSAQRGGADRIELCTSPGEGGTTPSYGFIEQARKALHIPFYVMIRPRGGDFLFSDEEFEIMQRDVEVCRKLKADGIVIGMLDEDGNIDVKRCAKLMELAGHLGVTFHRAFDHVRDYRKSLEEVISLGCERILTSGLHPTCESGIDIIKDMVDRAAGRISIMPGSGVRPANIRKIVESTGVLEIHSSASKKYSWKIKYNNTKFAAAPSYTGADEHMVKLMVDALSPN